MDESASWFEALLRAHPRVVDDLQHLCERTGAVGSAAELLDGYYRALYAGSRDIIITLGRGGCVEAVNPRGAALLGAADGRLVGQPAVALFAATSAADVVGLLQAGFVGDSDGVVVLADGRRATLSVSRPIDGAVVVLILRDVTHVHHLQKALQHARGLAGVGRLAGDLAADIANPLAVIEGRIALLLARPDVSPADLRAELLRMRTHSQRINHTVRNLQAIAAPQPPEPARIALRPLFEDAIAALGRRTQRIRLDVAVRPPDLRTYADPRQLRQLVVNLLTEAVDRSPVGRTVTVTADTAGGDVLIRVSDQGAALQPSLHAALEAEDPAAGLSLTITAALAKRNGGQLSVTEPLTGGVVATVRLTLRAAAPLPAVPASLRLLVIDPERLLGELVAWMLSGTRYKVSTVRTVAAALRLLPEHDFDSVLAAAGCAGLDGRFPRVIRVGEDAVVSGDYLQKPFTRQALLSVLSGAAGG